MPGRDKTLEPLDLEEDLLEGDDSGVRQRLEAFIPDLVRRTLAAGMGAFVTTEEGIRRIARDMSLPKEVAGYLANTAGATKDEIMRLVAREIREFLQTVNLSDEIAKMLTTLSFEVKTEIRFIPNDQKMGSVQPEVKSKVKLRRTGAERRRFGKKTRRLRKITDDEVAGKK
jgi:hypothetical protein